MIEICHLDTSYVIDNTTIQRKSEDTKVDERGKPLHDLCILGRLRKLNGRYTGDTYANATCQNAGASVVDNVILLEEQ